MRILQIVRRKLLARFGWMRRARRLARRVPAEVLRRLSFTPRLGPPRGMFSLEEQVRQGHVEGNILSEGAPLPPPDEGSLRMIAHRLGLQPPHRLFAVFWARCPEARLVGDTLLLLNRRKQASLEAMFTYQHEIDLGYNYCWLPPAVRLPGRWVSLVGMFSQSYYHWMVEALPRLAVLAELPDDTGILVHGSLVPFQEQTLRLMKLDGRVRRTGERHLIVEDFYFVPPAGVLGTQHPASIRFLRETFLPHADDSLPANKSFFVMRRNHGVGSRGVLNESEVRGFFEKRGWAVLNLEDIPWTRQLHLFAQAERICAVHGGGLTNLLWCQPGCKVLELCVDNYPNGCYEVLAKSVGADYRYMMSKGLEYGNLRVDLGRLERELDAMG